MALASRIALAADARAGDARAGDVLRLRREINRMQRRRSDLPLLPVPPALQPLLPEGGLQIGTTYSLSPSPGLIGALLGPTSGTGAWCAVIGMPTLGVEALAGHGVDLNRLLLIPDPGLRWLSVLSTLSEVIPLIAVRPTGPVREAELSRLSARLRDRGCTVLVISRGKATSRDHWPQSEGSIRVHDPRWQGLGSGWGALEACMVTVTAHTRRLPTPQNVRVRLPGTHGAVETVASPTPRLLPLPSRSGPARSSEETAQLLAVAG